MKFLIWIIKFHLYLVKILMYPYKLICSLQKRKMCPPVENLLLLRSAKKLAHMIRNRQITCKEVIQSYITRIKEVNPVLNAVVDQRFEEALAEAKEIDRFLVITKKTEKELEKDTPLLGIPFTVKESISVSGMSNAAGVYHSKIPIAKEDAEIVRLCKDAGAIPICVTNTPELCMYWETFNNVTGLTKNPYDTRKTVGGSSGGEAALLSSGASILGLGSDICGSLRLPPLFTGVFGHKPTAEIISIQGHVPESCDEKWPKVFVLGPMTRYAEDMALIFPILTKPEMRHKLKLNEPVSINKLKFYYLELDTNEETILAMRTFANYVKKEYGVKAEKISIRYMRNAATLFQVCTLNMIPLKHVECVFYDNATKTYSVWKHILKKIFCMSKITAHALICGIMLTISKYIKNQNLAAAKLKEKVQNELKDLLGDNGVLLIPTFSNTAHFHKQIIHKVLDSFYLTIFNVLGMPSTQCPAGYTSEGMPFGFQVVANPFNDRLTIAVAAEVEKLFKGWRPPQNKDENGVFINNFVL